MSEEFTGKSKRWFVLLVQDNSDVLTQCPGAESFFSESEAIKFAKESSREDESGGDGAVYHVMRSTHIVESKRLISVKVVPIK
jgi:hypothetical protein